MSLRHQFLNDLLRPPDCPLTLFEQLSALSRLLVGPPVYLPTSVRQPCFALLRENLVLIHYDFPLTISRAWIVPLPYADGRFPDSLDGL